MTTRVTPLLVALGLLLVAALPSAAAAVVRPPTSQETAVSPVPDHGVDPANARSYFGARYYRSDIGRFTTVDPELNMPAALVDPQRWNRYAYVRNNPLRYVDPDGRADVAALCAGKASCNVDVQQTVRLFKYDEESKSYAVYSTLSVTTTSSVTAGSGGAAIASATSSVSNVSGHQFSSSELSKMSGVMGQIQGSGVFSGFGGNTTQLLTSFAAKESLMGAAAAAQGAPAFKDPAVNPLQLSGGRANLDLQHNIEGALGVVGWAGRSVGFDPARTYSRFSGQPAETVRLFMLFYSNLAEMVR